MSRVTEALKRATVDGVLFAAHEDETAVVSPVTSGPVARETGGERENWTSFPPAETFVSPWSFEEQPEARRAASDGERRSKPAPVAPGPGALFRGYDPRVRDRLVVGEHQANAAVMAMSVEQYRKLAATLHHAQAERDLRVVMITSALAGEGKTLTATNLALTLSESYRRKVLLIDADLRRPGLQQVFQVPAGWGLSEALKDGTPRRLSLLQITANLVLLPAGSPDPDPMSLLTSERMRRILEEAAGRFDWVIVDAPPVGLLTDASLLAKMVHGTLIVAQAGKTDYGLVRKAVEAIGRERILGVVLNRAAVSDGVYGYKYDKYYAGYSHK